MSVYIHYSDQRVTLADDYTVETAVRVLTDADEAGRHIALFTDNKGKKVVLSVGGGATYRFSESTGNTAHFL